MSSIVALHPSFSVAKMEHRRNYFHESFLALMAAWGCVQGALLALGKIYHADAMGDGMTAKCCSPSSLTVNGGIFVSVYQ